MEPLGLVDRFISWCFSRPIKRTLCNHQIVTSFTAEIFYVSGYERCGGTGICSKCGDSFTVYVPADAAEQEHAMQSVA
jgi:hypothetical protein